MLILAIFIGAVVGFAGGFAAAIVCLYDYENDEENYAEFYEAKLHELEDNRK
jgi:hypothetical protein